MIRSTTTSAPKRTLGAGLIAAGAIAVLLACPQVRTSADLFLLSLRIQNVVFMPITSTRLQELRDAHIDPSTLFIGTPREIGQPAPPQNAATPDDAARISGFDVVEPSSLPDRMDSRIEILAPRAGEAQVDVDSVRQDLSTLGIDDVSIPDAFGASPIKVDIGPTVVTDFSGEPGRMNLLEGESPNVTMPPGTDLAELGRAGLRVLGMTPDRADALSEQIDWRSTLVVPFPKDMNSIRQVEVGGQPALLVGNMSRHDSGGHDWAIYWQRGVRFFVLEGHGPGIDDGALVQVANSISDPDR